MRVCASRQIPYKQLAIDHSQRMGRKLSEFGSLVRKYYTITSTNSTCTLCGRMTPGFHTGNLARHLERKHPEAIAGNETLLENSRYLKLIEVEDVTESCNEGESGIEESTSEVHTEEPPEPKKIKLLVPKRMMKEDSTLKYSENIVEFHEIPTASTSQQPEEVPKTEIAVPNESPFSANALQEHYINMVIVDGFPVNFMEGQASSQLFSILNQSAGIDNIFSLSIEAMIVRRAAAFKKTLQDELSGKVISVHLQTLETPISICSVIVQYIHNGALQRRFIGAKTNADGDLLDYEAKLDFMTESCSQFGIDHNRVYSIMCEGGETDPEYHIPCLLRLFTTTIQKELGKYQSVWDALGIDSIQETTLEDFLESLKNRQLKGQNSATLESLKEWSPKILNVYKTISGEVKVGTDVVAAVFKFWVQTKRASGSVAQSLASGIKKDFCDEIMKYETVIGAMFLDPRILQLLSTERQRKAQEHLKIMFMSWAGEEAGASEETIKTEETAEDNEEDDDDELTMFLKEKSMIKPKSTISSKIDRPLEDFAYVPVLSGKSDLLSFWESDKLSPHLKQLAQGVHSVIMVDRDFLDESFLKKWVQNNEFHSTTLQNAILFLGSNLRKS